MKVDSERGMMKVQKQEDVAQKDVDIGNNVIKVAAAATGCYQPLDTGKIFPMLRKSMAKHSARKTDLYKKIEYEIEKLCVSGILTFKNCKQKENMIGIAAATPEVFTPIVTRGRGDQNFVAAGDLSKGEDGKQIFPIADIDAIMNNCRVNWEQKVFMPAEDGSSKYVGTLRQHFKSLIPLGLFQCKDLSKPLYFFSFPI